MAITLLSVLFIIVLVLLSISWIWMHSQAPYQASPCTKEVKQFRCTVPNGDYSIHYISDCNRQWLLAEDVGRVFELAFDFDMNSDVECELETLSQTKRS